MAPALPSTIASYRSLSWGSSSYTAGARSVARSDSAPPSRGARNGPRRTVRSAQPVVNPPSATTTSTVTTTSGSACRTRAARSAASWLPGRRVRSPHELSSQTCLLGELPHALDQQPRHVLHRGRGAAADRSGLARPAPGRIAPGCSRPAAGRGGRSAATASGSQWRPSPRGRARIHATSRARERLVELGGPGSCQPSVRIRRLRASTIRPAASTVDAAVSRSASPRSAG